MTRLALAIIVVWGAQSFAASFDCSTAASLAEMTICNDPTLSALDEELFEIYKQAEKVAPDIKKFNEQSRASWKWREANCHTKECLVAWYSEYKATLQKFLDDGFLHNARNAVHLTLAEASKGQEMTLETTAVKVFPSKLQIFYEQVSLVLVAEFVNGSRVRLPYRFDLGYETDGEMSWEKKTNQYVLAQQDLTGDGVDEILFAVLVEDQGLHQAQVNVFQYFPPARSEDAGRGENWKLIGNLQALGIAGEPRINLTEGTVTIPRNHRGFYYEISWVKGRFIDTGNY